MLTLAFVADATVLIRTTAALQLPAGIAIGTILIGVAYIVGILADRMIDDSFEAMERHNRIRFACDQLSQWTRYDWKTKEYKDPYPEDQYRYQVMTKAKTVSDLLDYLRTRIRLMRALAFLLPGLVYSGVSYSTRGPSVCSDGTAGTVASGDKFNGPWFGTHAPFDVCNLAQWLNGPEVIVAAYLLAVAAKFVAMHYDPIRTIGRTSRRDTSGRAGPGKDEIVYVFKPPNDAFKWPRSSCRLLAPAGRWRPADTRKHKEMRVYAAERRWMTKHHASYYLLGDIVLQPFIVMALCLFMLSIWNAQNASKQPVLIPIIVIGALVEVYAVWAWWRITKTFMAYLRGAGEFLQRSSGPVVG